MEDSSGWFTHLVVPLFPIPATRGRRPLLESPQVPRPDEGKQGARREEVLQAPLLFPGLLAPEGVEVPAGSKIWAIHVQEHVLIGLFESLLSGHPRSQQKGLGQLKEHSTIVAEALVVLGPIGEINEVGHASLVLIPCAAKKGRGDSRYPQFPRQSIRSKGLTGLPECLKQPNRQTLKRQTRRGGSDLHIREAKGSSWAQQALALGKESGPASSRQEADQVSHVDQVKAVISKDSKVVVMFRATGNAPILKQVKFKISAHFTFQSVADFLRRQLKFNQNETLVLFCNSAFSPAPDALVADLAQCFHVDGCLVINYALTAAWG